LFPGLADLLPLLVIFVASILVVVLLMGPFMRFLVRRNRVVEDSHKPGGPQVPSPAGPLLAFALIVGELVAFLAYHSLLPAIIILVILVSSFIGLADDLFVLGGKVKPLLLLLAAAPIGLGHSVAGDVYISKVFFPFFPATSEHFTIYTVLVLAAIPIVSNAYNMMDAFNGEVSGFTLLTSVALIIGIGLRAYAQSNYSVDHIAIALPLIAVSLGFYFFNRYPARVFDGDSGSLAFGAMFASLAIVGGVELAAVVAIIPAILNSFYILSSVRGFVERRRMNARPTRVGEDGILYATKEATAPTTLVRMILFNGPLGEKDLVRTILVLTGFACFLSVLTSILTWVY
jgi:UDP-N-acetylglucosamine--dolichyl-phosphate N-acetylglucosaminephosphotransferase